MMSIWKYTQATILLGGLLIAPKNGIEICPETDLISRVNQSSFVRVYQKIFTKEDYLYAESTKHRILQWQDIG